MQRQAVITLISASLLAGCSGMIERFNQGMAENAALQERIRSGQATVEDCKEAQDTARAAVQLFGGRYQDPCRQYVWVREQKAP